jgi:hypothetical protein
MSGPEIEEENKVQSTSNEDVEATSRTQIYTPACPDNAPAVLTFSNVTVTKRGSNKKKLLNNVSGSMTGGLWAIMGEPFGISLSIRYENRLQAFLTFSFSITTRPFWQWQNHSPEHSRFETQHPSDGGQGRDPSERQRVRRKSP